MLAELDKPNHYFQIVTEYENAAKVLLFETNSIVSFFNKFGSIDEIQISIPSISNS
jgi:hypothetical protein